MPDTQTPTDVLATDIFDAFKAARCHQPDYTEFDATLLQVFRGLATIIAIRDEKFDSRTATVAGLEAQQAWSDTRLANLEAQVITAQVSATNALTVATDAAASATDAYAFGHSAIHSAADKRIAAIHDQSLISRRDPLRQL
jgi:uncharacterized protein YecT (DUF1311 family)